MNKKTMLIVCISVAVLLLLAVAVLLLRDKEPNTPNVPTTTQPETVNFLPGEGEYDPSVMDQEPDISESTVAMDPDDTTAPSGEKEDTNQQTKPQETQPVTQPETTKPETGNKEQLTYEQYLALSKDEQVAFVQSFETTDAYFEWYNAAKAEYDQKEVGELDGPIDFSPKP